MTKFPVLEDLDDLAFNPFLEEGPIIGTHADPYPTIAALRAQGTVLPGGYREAMGLPGDITLPRDAPQYLVLGYEEVSAVLMNPQLFTNHVYSFNLGQAFGRSVSTMDAPEHTIYRRVFQRAFLPKYIKEWGSAIVDPVVNDLLNVFIRSGRGDLIQQFTQHYPFGVIYRQLDLPLDQAKIFHKLAVTQTLISLFRDEALEATRKLGEFFVELINQRRSRPGDDLVSLLVTTEVDGQYLPEDVLVSFLRQLINAAGDTTYRSTSVLLTKLLENPDQLEAIRRDRSLIANAIEEALRYDGPVVFQDRWVTADTELGGVNLPAGAILHLIAGSANRDPIKFDDPDVFDIRRPNAARHFSFSGGPHICIGQHLARIEMTRALTAILDRLPNVRLDPDRPQPQLKGAMMRVPHHLHVIFDMQPGMTAAA